GLAPRRDALFLKRSFRSRSAFQRVPMLTRIPNRSRNSSKVASGCSWTKRRNSSCRPPSLVWRPLLGYAPIEDIGRCKHCAKLFIIAENEELFDNKDHAILAHGRAAGVKKLVTIKGIKHYGIYREARDQAQKEAIAWFDEHLKGK